MGYLFSVHTTAGHSAETRVLVKMKTKMKMKTKKEMEMNVLEQ